MADDWRVGLTSSSEIYRHLLEHGLHADCSFSVIGHDKEEAQVFRCHKIIMSHSSPVFEAMFYGELADKGGEVVITDIKPNIFKQMLTYVYTVEMTFSSVAEAMELALAADKYMLTLLKEKCAEYLSHHVDVSNVLNILQCDVMLSSEVLKKACVEIIQQFTRMVINQKDFRLSSEATLLLILSQETVTCDEYELVMSAERWAEHQVKLRNLPDNDASVRACLEPLIPHMRLAAMSEAEFDSGPGQSSWLTDEEKTYVRDNLDDSEINLNINKEKTPRKTYEFTLRSLSKLYPNYFFYLPSTSSKFELFFKFKGDSNSVLLGVEMFSQVDPPSGAVKYCENITLKLYSLSSNRDNISHTSTEIYSMYNFQIANISYCSKFDISLNSAIPLIKNTHYLLEITCHVAGRYPTCNLKYYGCPVINTEKCNYSCKDCTNCATPLSAFVIVDQNKFTKTPEFELYRLKNKVSTLISKLK